MSQNPMKFVSQKIDTEADLKKNTVGLVRLDDFQKIRETVLAKQQRQSSADQHSDDDPRHDKSTPSGATAQKRKTKLLSFDEDESEQSSMGSDMTHKKTRKDPLVDTSFLPDRYREEEEEHLKKELRRQWLERQKLIKDQPIEVKFSLVDGIQQAKSVNCKKSDSVKTFLTRAREHSSSLKNCQIDQLMYVIQDIIVHHTCLQHYTFYDILLNKAKGVGGLFYEIHHYQDLTEDEMKGHKDKPVSVGKVIKREWYDNNKHIYPASRWKYYDPLNSN